VWQAQYTEPSGGVAEPSGGTAARVAAARGWRSCGRRSTQSRLAGLLRAWSPLARRWRSCTVPAWRNCCADGRRWPAAGIRVAGLLMDYPLKNCLSDIP